MTIASAVEGATIYESDLDVSYVANLSSVGTLADEVVADLIKADAHLKLTSDSLAIRHAADLFATTVRVAEEPATVRSATGLSEALRQMSALPREMMEPNKPAVTADWMSILKATHSALQSAVSGNASPQERDLLKAQFAGIAAGTMDAMLTAVHSRSRAFSWLTA